MKLRASRLSLVGVVLLAVAAIPSCRHAGRTTATVEKAREVRVIDPPKFLRVRWQQPLYLDRVRAVHMAEDLVLVESAYGRLLAVDVETGTFMWSKLQPHPFDREPAAAAKMVYYFAGGRMVAVRRDSGHEILNRKLPIVPVTNPIPFRDQLLCGSSEGRINGVGMTTAWPEWFKRYEAHVVGVSLSGNERIIVLDGDGVLYAHSPKDGSILWSAELKKPPLVGPAASAKRVYIGGADSYVYAFDARGGDPLWKTPCGSPFVQRPHVAHGVVVAGLYTGEAAGVDAASGRLLWKIPDIERFVTATAERAYFMTKNRVMLCVGLRDGVERGRLDLQDAEFVVADAAKGQFFAVDRNGTVTGVADVASLPRPEYLRAAEK